MKDTNKMAEIRNTPVYMEHKVVRSIVVHLMLCFVPLLGCITRPCDVGR